MKFTQDCSMPKNKLMTMLGNADAVLIGAGAGLSTSAGFTYSGKRFFKYFADFHAKYGITDMYSGGFHPFESLEEYWAYWSRYIMINRYTDPPKPVYNTLFDIVKTTDYFVITTNVDHCFQKSGFEKTRLFYTQGDYGLFQCSVPCHNATYDNEDTIRRMVTEQKDMRVPSELIPRCPKCGKPMTVSLLCDDTFVQDDGWEKARNRYERFLGNYANEKILLMELGVGNNTPAIIKYPFWRFMRLNSRASYVCINYGGAVVPRKIENRSLRISDDICNVLQGL